MSRWDDLHQLFRDQAEVFLNQAWRAHTRGGERTHAYQYTDIDVTDIGRLRMYSREDWPTPRLIFDRWDQNPLDNQETLNDVYQLTLEGDHETEILLWLNEMMARIDVA